MKQRIEYIDAARGLAIFTVVYSHICLFCLPGYESSAVIDFLRTYFLNAFFLISGLLAFRNRIESRTFLRLLWKRVYQLLIPTVIIGLTYALSHDISPASFFFNEAKYGYWFTISLFEMFVIYYVFIILTCRFVRPCIPSVVFMVISLLAYFFFKTHPIDLNGLLCWDNTISYIPFFALGISIQANKPLLISIKHRIGGDNLFFGLFILVIASYLLPFPMLIQRFMVVFLVVWVIYAIYSKQAQSKFDGIFRHLLVLFGTNTLEIYFLHYFLLFPMPQQIGYYLERVSNSGKSLSMPEFLVVGTSVIIISIFCIALSRILKQIPYVSLLIFGKSSSN